METTKNKKNKNIILKIIIFSVMILLLIGIADLISSKITGKSVLNDLKQASSNPLSSNIKNLDLGLKINNNLITTKNDPYKNLKFDVNAAPVKLPEEQKVGDLNSYTIEATFYLDTDMRYDKHYPWYPIVAEYIGGSARGTDRGRYILSLPSQNQLVFTINTKGMPNNIVSAPGDYNKKWTNAIVVVDNTKLKEKARLYVNGKLISTSDTYPIDKSSSGYNLFIGTLPNNYGTVAPTEYFSGIIREVKLYKKALSEEEIKILFKEQTGKCTKDIECTVPGQSCVNSICQFKVSDGHPINNTGNSPLNRTDYIPSNDSTTISETPSVAPSGESSGGSGGSGGSSGGSGSGSSINTNSQTNPTPEESFGDSNINTLQSENNQQQIQENSGVKEILPQLNNEPEQNRNIYLAISILLVLGGISGLYLMLKKF
ncbi:hypothetical protein J4476_05900 [Candidatus Woesearchaeota archaeon]|nr:MAG: hypothetical protein QT09_C0002G0038 [archaeon GW2011_AR18]MBS3162200.1 hypothetical protein [Candidatus Woesearchaeota archaeon]HIH26088.1 hypothetical protein [Nanoarchaeota archaeon]